MVCTSAVRKVLVTGASGFIGHHCLEPLVKRGYEVHAVTSKAGVRCPDSPITWHQADLLDCSAGWRLIEEVKPSHLLHLAWYVVPGKLITSDINFRWVSASMDLLAAFRNFGGQRVVMPGSSYEYDWSYGYCHESRTPTVPNTVYGACKNALNTMVQAFCRTYGMSHAWPRIFFLYGPNEHQDRLVSSVIRSVLQGREAACSHGLQIRDYLHVQDVADATVSILDSEAEGAFNIGSGTAVALREIVLTIGRSLGREDLIKLGAIPSRANDAPLVVADIERLRSELKWQPRFSMNDGLMDTIEWWRRTIRQDS